MSLLINAVQLFREDKKNFLYRLLGRTCGSWMPDRLYLKILFHLFVGKKLDFKDPQTFGEKLQWLKVYNRKPEYTTMVDKYAVKDYLGSIIGEKYIIPTLGVWDNPEEIDFDTLPNQFVLKPTQGGGGSEVVICRDKASFNKNDAIMKLKAGLKQDSYRYLREWPYKNVPRRVIAEQYIEDSQNPDGLQDYKFFCFDGCAKCCQVIGGRQTTMHVDFFDKDWNLLPFQEPAQYPHAKIVPTKPEGYELMWSIAETLSAGIPFVRIDLYNIKGVIYFGEITFFPTSGHGLFAPKEWNYIFGDYIKLPKNSK